MQEMGQGRATPLQESGLAPRFLVTDIDRLEFVADGIYCFVCTCPTMIEGQQERKVVVYIDCTWQAIARGIYLALMHVKELVSLKHLIGGLSKMVSMVTFH